MITKYLNSFATGEEKNNLLNKYKQYDVVFIDDFQLLKGEINLIKCIYDVIENLYKSDKSVIIISKCDIEDIKIDLVYSFYYKISKYIIE